MSRSEKVRLAQREARKARRGGDDETAALWLGVAIRELRGEEDGGEQNELLAALLVSRGAARQRLHTRLRGQGVTRARANGLADDALADYIEATRRSPAMTKAHRKRIRITLSRKEPLPVLLSQCADVHDAIGLGTDLTAVQWQLSQLEPEPELDPDLDLSEGHETVARGEEPSVGVVGVAGIADEVHARAADLAALLPELERTIVTQLVHKYATYADGSLASVAVALASEAQDDVQQQHAQFGIVLLGTRQEQQRQEAAALWALLRLAQPQDLAVCADMLCRRLVAHLGADMSDLGAGVGCRKDNEVYRELLCRCTVAEQLIRGLRQMGLQTWRVESQQVHRPIAPRHCYDPARAHRLAQRAALAESDAGAAELRALLLRAEAPSPGAAVRGGERGRAHDEQIAALMEDVAAAGHRRYSAAQNAQLLRQVNPTDRDEARVESHDVGLGPFRRPTEVTLVLSDDWDSLVSSLESWQQVLTQT